MPDENINNQGAGGNDDAAVVEDNNSANEGADGSGDGNGGGEGEENITMKKSEIEKLQADLQKSNEDRDNYRKGLLQKKADERSLEGDGGKGGQSGSADNVIDENKISEIASTATNKALRAASEKTAKRAFLQAHPEYVDDAQWTALMSNLTFKGNELTHDDVVDRMEAALFEHKRSTGKLEDYLKSEHERGVREGRIQGELGSGYGTGGAGDRNEGGKGMGKLSPRGEEVARAMHVDPEKVKKVEPSKDNVINVL